MLTDCTTPSIGTATFLPLFQPPPARIDLAAVATELAAEVAEDGARAELQSIAFCILRARQEAKQPKQQPRRAAR